MSTPIISYQIPSRVSLEEIASATYTTVNELKQLNPSLRSKSADQLAGLTIKVQQTFATDRPLHVWPIAGDHQLKEAELRQNLAVLDNLSTKRNETAVIASSQEEAQKSQGAAPADTKEQNQAQGSSLEITTGQSCEAGKLIVEIVGEVPADYVAQRILIYTEDSKFDQAKTDQLKREIPLADDILRSSTLHTWDWDTCQKGQLYLEIATTGNKGPIRLPLMEQAMATPRQGGRHHQLNLIVPVVPMTIIKDKFSLNGKLSEYNKLIATDPVLCRTGWIYLYYHGKLWRELHIQQNIATGETTYHDVRLEFEENGKLKDTKNHKREPEGVALTEIWLPARWNDQEQTIQAFYAESQLTALRLNYLQSNPTALNNRSHSINMIPQIAKFVAYAKHTYPNKPFLLKTNGFTVANHIPRNPAVEYHVTNPSRYLLDTTGKFLENEYSKAKEKLAEFDQDSYDPKKTYTVPQTDQQKGFGQEINVSAYSYQLKQILLQKAKNSGCQENVCSPDKTSDVLAAKYQVTKDEDNKIWQSKQPTTQVLTKPIAKKICGLYLADPLYDVRHREQQANLSKELQKYLAERASLKKQHGNAILVNNIMYASKQIDEKNPLYKATKQLTQHGWSKINFALGAVERKRLNDYIDLTNNQLATLFNTNLIIETFKDLTSYCGLDYLANCEYILTALNNAAAPAELSDPLSTAFMSKPKVTATSEILSGLFKRESKSPYYKMFFDADYNPVELLDDYQPPANQTERVGDGSWYPAEIAKLLDQDQEILNLDNSMSLQGAYLASRINSGLTSFLTVDSKLASAILIYIDVLDATIKQELRKIEGDSNAQAESETTAQAEEQRKLNGLESDAKKIEAEQKRLQQQQTDLTKQFGETQNRLYTLETELASKKQTLYQIDRALYEAKKDANAYATRWGDKTPATITNQEILQWQPAGNSLVAEIKQTALNINATQQQLAELKIQQQQIKQQLIAKTEELAAKNQQIAETKAKIEKVQQSPANNKKLRFSLDKRYQFISAQTARELLDSEIGLRLDEIGEGKPLPKDRIILGADPKPVSVNGTPVLDQIETNRRKLHNATASVIKIENGQPVAPKGVSPSKVAQAVKQGNTVVLTTHCWTVSGNKKFWRSYRRQIDKLRPYLNILIDEANGMAANQSAFLRSLEQVEKDMAATEKKLAEFKQQQNTQLETDHQAKTTADGKVATIEQQQANTKTSIDTTEQQIDREFKTGQQQIDQQAANQTRLDELSQQQADNRAAQQRSQTTIEGHRTASSAANKTAAAAAKDLAAMERNAFKALGNLATQEGAVQELAATRNRLDILGPLLPAFIVGLEINNIVSLSDYEKNIQEKGLYRYGADIISASFNTLAAFDLLGAKIIANQQGWYHSYMNARAITAPTLSPKMQETLGISFISKRLWLQGIAAFAGFVLSVCDLYKSIGRRNTGQIVGYGIVSAGSAALLVSTFLSGGGTAATIFGLTTGWWLALGFALFALGYFVIEAFTYTPFEEWIKFGPFAEPSSGGIFSRSQYPELEDDKNQADAFYRLISLIAGMRIDFKEVTDQEWGQLASQYSKPKRAMRMSIGTSLPGLLNNPAAYFTIADVQLGFGDSGANEGIPITDYFQQNTPDGVNLYFDMQADTAKAVALRRQRQLDHYKRNGLEVTESEVSLPTSAIAYYIARLQVRVYDQQANLKVYPAPLPLEKVSATDAANYKKLPPLHSNKYTTFWLKKDSHADRVRGEGY